MHPHKISIQICFTPVWDKLFIWLWSMIIRSKTSLSFSGSLGKKGLKAKALSSLLFSKFITLLFFPLAVGFAHSEGSGIINGG